MPQPDARQFGALHIHRRPSSMRCGVPSRTGERAGPSASHPAAHGPVGAHRWRTAGRDGGYRKGSAPTTGRPAAIARPSRPLIKLKTWTRYRPEDPVPGAADPDHRDGTATRTYAAPTGPTGQATGRLRARRQRRAQPPSRYRASGTPASLDGYRPPTRWPERAGYSGRPRHAPHPDRPSRGHRMPPQGRTAASAAPAGMPPTAAAELPAPSAPVPPLLATVPEPMAAPRKRMIDNPGPIYRC